MENRPFLVE